MADDLERYLDSKRSVDDRALNRRVWERLARELRAGAAAELDVCDVGAGTGIGVERMVRWDLFPAGAARFTLVEPEPPLADRARARLSELGLRGEVCRQTLAEFAARASNRDRFHLVVAHAVLDLLELDSALDCLVSLLAPKGLLYLPITFDGETALEPAHPHDEAVLDAYHRSMEPTGDGRAGRRLYHALRHHPVELLELGSSDWILCPGREGYPEDERYFLHFLVSTIEAAVAGRVERRRLTGWARERRRQIEAAELVFIAHQLDALARKQP